MVINTWAKNCNVKHHGQAMVSIYIEDIGKDTWRKAQKLQCVCEVHAGHVANSI